MLSYQQLNSEDVKNKFLLVSGVRDTIVTVKVFLRRGKLRKIIVGRELKTWRLVE